MSNALTNVHAASPAEVESALLNPDVSMVILTWVTFLVLSVVLYKFAWDPILKALDAREESLAALWRMPTGSKQNWRAWTKRTSSLSARPR